MVDSTVRLDSIKEKHDPDSEHKGEGILAWNSDAQRDKDYMDEDWEPAAKAPKNFLRRIPNYVWISLAVFAVIETLAVVGCVYYARSVRNDNIVSATGVATTSARALEKLMEDQKAPVLSLADAVAVTPHWPTYESNFETLCAAIYKNYKYYQIEAMPAAQVLAMSLPWSNATGKEKKDLLEFFDFGLDILTPFNRPSYWAPLKADLDTVVQDDSIILIGPWYGPGELSDGAFVIRYNIFLNKTIDWEIPEGEGIKNCPKDICNTPDGKSLWGWTGSIFAWRSIIAGLRPLKDNNLLYSLMPDRNAYNQSFLAISNPAPSGDTCVQVDIFEKMHWTLCVEQEGGFSPGWTAGLIVGVTALCVVLSGFLGMILRSRSQAHDYLTKEVESNKIITASRDALEAEKKRLQALMVRQYELIECFGKKGPTQASHKSFTDKIKDARSQLAESGADEMAEANKIELLTLLGQGSFGTVYLGEWRGTTVAVKRIVLPAAMSNSDRAEKMAIMEVAISSAMSHPHLVQTYTYSIRPLEEEPSNGGLQLSVSNFESGATNNQTTSNTNTNRSGATAMSGPVSKYVKAYELRLVLEYCDRGALRSLLEHRGFRDDQGLNLAAIVETAADVAKGMLHLHSHNILHTDLKACNVMLKSSGGDGRGVMAKVMDFGLSITLETAETHVSSMFQGTISHMAPEVLMEGKQSKAADVYAFGITMWEIYTGGMPYRGVARVVLSHLVVFQNKRPKFPEGTPAEYKDLAERCWQPTPEKRPTFKEALEELRKIRESLGGKTRTLKHTELDSNPNFVPEVQEEALDTAVYTGPPVLAKTSNTPSSDGGGELEANIDASWMSPEGAAASPTLKGAE